MHLLVLILGSVLLPRAFTLKCYECIPGASGNCTDTLKDCSPSMQCGALRVTTYMGNTKLSDVDIKSCTVAAQCVSGSLNLGNFRTLINSKCCSTDSCNSQRPQVSSSSSNGKTCYTCNGQDCTGTLKCSGDEDYCISAKVKIEGQEMIMKGCASNTMCPGGTATQMAGDMSTDMSCCQGNLCNNARSTGFSLLLLVASVTSVVLFH